MVVGVPDARTGEQRLKAVVVRAADESPDTLIRYCRERLASHVCTRRRPLCPFWKRGRIAPRFTPRHHVPEPLSPAD